MKKFTALFIAALFFTTAANAIEAGVAAPDFNKKDINGTEQSISKYKGKVIVLEWTNPECPFVKKFYEPGKMQEWQKAATSDGVIWLSVNSSAPSKQGNLTAEQAKVLVAEQRIDSTAYILDEDGAIGKTYGAASTPTVIVIGKDGKVSYFGAVDDKPNANSSDIATARNYLAEAITAAKEGKNPAVTATKSYGCGVKYAN